MLVTLAVLNVLKSRLSKRRQPRNMFLMFVTLDEVKLLRSRLVNSKQFSNIPFMLVTLEVFQEPPRSMLCKM